MLNCRHKAPTTSRQAAPNKKPLELVRKTWVTRSGVHIDRMACAWLTPVVADRTGTNYLPVAQRATEISSF